MLTRFQGLVAEINARSGTVASQTDAIAAALDELGSASESQTGSTQEIGTLIRQIQESANQAISDVRGLAGDFTTRVSQTEEAYRTIVAMQGAVEEVQQIANRIGEALGEQSSASQLISQQVQRIAQMADESHLALTEVGRGTQQLDAASQELASHVSRFKE